MREFYLQILCALSTWVIICAALEFDKQNFGVVFSPFVKHAENGNEIPATDTYTLENIKTMMEVVSGKFSKLLVSGLGENQSNDDTRVLSSNVAAAINKNLGRTRIRITIEIEYMDSSLENLHTEMATTILAADKCNRIFPGTVEGITIHIVETEILGSEFLQNFRLFRQNASAFDLKLGTTQNCFYIFSQNTLSKVMRLILLQSDFIICWVEATNQAFKSGPQMSFRDVGKALLNLRNNLININNQINVMGITSWASEGKNQWENVTNQKIYWQEANKWASKNEFTVFLTEAIDNPLREHIGHSGHLGWWKLESNLKINLLSGYVEKYSEVSVYTLSTPWSTEVIIGTVLGGLILFLLTTLAALFAYWQKNKSRVAASKKRKAYLHSKKSPKTFKWGKDDPESVEGFDQKSFRSPLEIKKKNIRIDKSAIISQGEFRTTYKAIIITNGTETTVALKVPAFAFQREIFADYLKEIRLLVHVGYHPNIVKLVGAYTAELRFGIVYVAMEWCSVGNLQNFLRCDHQIRTITDEIMVKWAFDIACGMSHLEEKCVVHGDIAARNIYLTFDNMAKIAGFNKLSHRLYESTFFKLEDNILLPIRWMAIESIKKSIFSTKSDVWSYGVLLWEIFSMGEMPYSVELNGRKLIDKILTGLRLDRPSYASSKLFQIMQNCWEMEPKERPSFLELKNELEKLIQTTDNNVDAFKYFDMGEYPFERPPFSSTNTQYDNSIGSADPTSSKET